jgi:hypothetical protein
MTRAAGPTHFYVWYEVHGELAAAVSSIGALIDEVEAETGVRGRLLARRDQPSTWMEVYEDVDDPRAFQRVLDARVAALGALAFAEGGRRHTERFAALADALA